MNRDEYYMNIACAVREKANCTGRKVGAVVVKDNRIISTGYNGTPEGMTNCLDGGCARCADKEAYDESVGYDVCICVHAEQNALITAARFGNSIEGCIVYSTLRPCFDCSKAMLQAKVHTVYYLHDWKHPIGSLQAQYEKVQNRIPGGVRQIAYEDAKSDWANGKSS
ncbi:deoxycytidylate deaminase [Arenicella xantha]|uniref:dCMP deaminase n=1 Tax=Arenicella xantha TaxID=644221 RepID=A0A395JJX1_9GAMM|nr:dCMP deaminase family protein [Arenicella xantha]RBP47001.1 dCMP deaminase [Arenicella xantha]